MSMIVACGMMGVLSRLHGTQIHHILMHINIAVSSRLQWFKPLLHACAALHAGVTYPRCLCMISLLACCCFSQQTIMLPGSRQHGLLQASSHAMLGHILLSCSCDCNCTLLPRHTADNTHLVQAKVLQKTSLARTAPQCLQLQGCQRS
jgi:hypothetical protein